MIFFILYKQIPMNRKAMPNELMEKNANCEKATALKHKHYI